MTLRIAVIGGGIGGLTAAVALLQAGFEVEVYEQAPELTEVGGGINMAPNATRVLRRLGLAEGLDHEGVRPLGTHQRRWQDGRTLQRTPLNPLCEELYGAPHITIHRADLLAVIAAAFPAERVHLGHRLVGLAERSAPRPVRQRRAHRCGCADRCRRHSFGGEVCVVRRRGAGLCRLRRLSRARPG
jgi:salicylate hydroxylase